MRETTSWNSPASTRQERVDVDDCRRSPMAGSRRPDGALRQWENSEGGPQLGGRRCDGARWSVATRRTNDSRRFGRNSRSEEHTAELQSLMRISYAVFCLTNKTQ